MAFLHASRCRRWTGRSVLLLGALILQAAAPAGAQNPWHVEPQYGKDGGLVVSLHDWNGDPASVSRILVCDENYNPLPDAIRESRPGRGIINTDEYDRFTFLIFTDVEGFGRLKFYADNGGRSYTVRDHRLDLNHELAKSRLENVRTRMAGTDVPPEAFSAMTRARLDDAESLLAAAAEAERDAYRLKLLEQSFRESLWAGEMVVQEEAEYRIAHSPRRLAFKFGANAFGFSRRVVNYERYFTEMWNAATVPFYLSRYEPVEGEVETETLRKMVAFLNSNGIVPKGHPLVWLSEDALPEWMDAYAAYPEAREILRRRVRREVEHWQGQIDMWDVISEAHDWANYYQFTPEELVDLTRVACEATREANPEAVRVVNLAYLTGDYAAGNLSGSGELGRPLLTPYEYARRVVQDEQVDFEILGLQMYFPGLDIFEIARLIDRYAELGKPLHITEVAAPSSMQGDDQAVMDGEDVVHRLGSWHEPWNPAVQAEWVARFYTLCYAHPDVHAVTWWDFADYPDHYFPHGGLIDERGNPKPAYQALKSLMDYWGVSPGVRDDWVPGQFPPPGPGLQPGEEAEPVSDQQPIVEPQF